MLSEPYRRKKMDPLETSAAVDSILAEKVKSIFDPPDAPSTDFHVPAVAVPLRFEPPSAESSDEEGRSHIRKFDSYVPKKTPSGMPSIKLRRKTPRVRNAPTCKYKFKKGQNEGKLCDVFCRIGEDFCGKHKSAAEKQRPDLDLEQSAVKVPFHRLKPSKTYKLLQVKERRVILADRGRLLKVALPGCLLHPLPKPGSSLIVRRAGKGERVTAAWENI